MGEEEEKGFNQEAEAARVSALPKMLRQVIVPSKEVDRSPWGDIEVEVVKAMMDFSWRVIKRSAISWVGEVNSERSRRTSAPLKQFVVSRREILWAMS